MSGSPPAVRAIAQVQSCLVACIGFDESPTTIQAWDLVTKKKVATFESAHILETTGIVNYYPTSTDKMNPLASCFFVTSSKDKTIKVWKLEKEGPIELIFVVDLDEAVINLALYEMDQYKGAIVPFVESQHFYVINFNLKSNANAENPEHQNDQKVISIDSHTIVMKFPSKHLAHTVLQLGQDCLVTVSENNWEHWDMARQKRKKLVSTTYGQMLHACKLTDSHRPGMEPRLLACEDSRILRIFSQRRYTGRILSRHNDCVRRLLKVPGKHLLITGADDGSIKC